MSVNSQLDNHGMEELQRPFGSDVVMLGVLEVGVANLKIVASKVMEWAEMSQFVLLWMLLAS